jgi:hypothetical protein
MSGWFGSPECRLAIALRKDGVHVTSRVRCAVRFAAMTGATITDAAYVFEVNPGAVWNCWERMFPDVPQPRRLGRVA